MPRASAKPAPSDGREPSLWTTREAVDGRSTALPDLLDRTCSHQDGLMPIRWLSADECNDLVPDRHHYDSTIGSLEDRDISTSLRCWRRHENVATADVDPSQLIDVDDEDGQAKAEGIRRSLRDGAIMPPVIVIHHSPVSTWPYELVEGRHRTTPLSARD